MIDLYRTLGTESTQDDLTVAIDQLAVQDPATGKMVDSVLGRPQRRRDYDRVHRQYRRIAELQASLAAPDATDTHRWSSRTLDFQPDEGESGGSGYRTSGLVVRERSGAAARYARQEAASREQRRLVRQRAERAARAGPTGDTDTSTAKQAYKADGDGGRPEGMSWEDYLAWLESMKRRGLEKRNIGPADGDFVMTPAGMFTITDANAGDGMRVAMVDAEGRETTLHWNRLSHPIEFEGRHYFHMAAE